VSRTKRSIATERWDGNEEKLEIRNEKLERREENDAENASFFVFHMGCNVGSGEKIGFVSG
jgi:hypothetical protein